MKTLPPQLVAEAFALSTARGADLLARLGMFRVWQGDLATMRGDNPRSSMPGDESGAVGAVPDAFLDTIVLARAIERLQPVCRAALAAIYTEQKDTAALAGDLDTEPASAQRILTNCERRLLEIYDELAETSRNDSTTVPQWVSEREHASVVGGRRR